MLNITIEKKKSNPQKKVFTPPGFIHAAAEHVIRKLRNTQWRMAPKKDGSGFTKFPGAVRGNRIDAHRKQQRIDQAFINLNKLPGTKLFITQTSQYNAWEGTEDVCRQSWDDVLGRQKRWEANIREDQRIGADAFLTVIEAHALGGAHGHCILNIPRELETQLEYSNEKERSLLRLTDKGIEAAIKEAWKIGNADVQVCENLDDAHSYLTKEVGKQGHCESAVERYRRGWNESGDEKYIENDCKKIFRQYFGAGRKLMRYSQNLKAAISEPKPLDEQDDQLTAEEKEKRDQQTLIIPRTLVYQTWFTLRTGKVDPDTKEGQILIDFYNQNLPFQKLKNGP